MMTAVASLAGVKIATVCLETRGRYSPSTVTSMSAGLHSQ